MTRRKKAANDIGVRPGKRSLTFYVPTEEHRRLKVMAAMEDTKMQALCEEAIALLLADRKSKERKD